MKGGICAAVDASTALGMKLVGVGSVIIWAKGDDTDSLREWFRSMTATGMGVMVLSPECADVLSQELLEKRGSGKVTPVVVVLPGEGEDRRAREMMRRAVGMEAQPGKGGRT